MKLGMDLPALNNYKTDPTKIGNKPSKLFNLLIYIAASNIPVVKEVEAFVDPEVFTVVRFVFAAIPFFPFVLQARDDIQTRNAGIELGTWVSLGYLMQALGLQTSDAGRASFISMFTVRNFSISTGSCFSARIKFDVV